jgi:hypothetical protein
MSKLSNMCRLAGVLGQCTWEAELGAMEGSAFYGKLEELLDGYFGFSIYDNTPIGQIILADGGGAFRPLVYCNNLVILDKPLVWSTLAKNDKTPEKKLYELYKKGRLTVVDKDDLGASNKPIKCCIFVVEGEESAYFFDQRRVHSLERVVGAFVNITKRIRRKCPLDSMFSRIDLLDECAKGLSSVTNCNMRVECMEVEEEPKKQHPLLERYGEDANHAINLLLLDKSTHFINSEKYDEYEQQCVANLILSIDVK